MIGLHASLVLLALAATDPGSGVSGKVSGLVFRTTNLQLRAEDLAGKVKDLAIKEAETEIRIELPADVLFAFDKAEIRPDAERALSEVAEIIKDKATGPVRVEGHTDSKGSASGRISAL